MNVSLKSVANILYKHRWSRSEQRGSNKTTVHAPGAARNEAGSSAQQQRQSVTPNVASPQVQEETIDIFAQPVASPLPAVLSPPSPVVLPEISLPAFFSQSAVEPTSIRDRPVMPLLSVRQPCPTCGCSSREHQNV